MTFFNVNPFVVYSSADDRLRHWKELRHQVSTMDDADALAMVAEYWSYAPLSNFSYNPEYPEDWPSPWEMVHKGQWCRLMLAPAMEFTLRLAGWDSSRMKLVYFRDYDISEEVFVLKIDDKIALNYSNRHVVDYPDTKQVILGYWQFSGKTYTPLDY